MKNFFTQLSCRLAMAVVMAFGLIQPLMAQYSDNPNLDRIPVYLRETANQQKDLPLSSVITINNFDNFNLGVDFAESNMAENPLNPAWYFTAYNTNTVHQTTNGIDYGTATPSFGTTMQGDPVVTYDSIGNLFYQNMYGSSSILGVKVMKSTDNGVTWGPPLTAVSGVDKNWMACDQTSGPYANYVYACMTASSGGNFSRSIDHGATWTTTFTPSTQSLPGMMVCVGPAGNIQGGSVYVVTNSGGSFNSTYTFYRSLDGGQTFTQMSAQTFSNTVGSQVSGRNSVENMRTRPYPMIAADNSYGTHRGRFYCVYASNDPPGSGNKPDIWCRYSDDGGASWSSAILVNDDANPQTHHQWHPAIWADKQTGRLYAMWMDTRDCPTNDSALIYASYSDNGGVTWAANQAISNQKMKINCSTCGGGGTPRYQGDYNGIVSNNKVAKAGWTDFRQGSFMSVTAYFPDFAMAVTPTSGNLFLASDSIDFTVNVPAVKLYSDTVVVSAQITPAPTAGTITVLYPQGNKITSFPGSRIVRIKLSGNVPLGSYQVNLFAKGPNGTPAHQRNATINVQASLALSVSVTANPQTVCPGASTQLQAFATGGSAPYTYSWTSNPPGFTSSISNPVASPAVNTRYICTVHDNVNAVKKDSVLVTLGSPPSAPGAIAGNSAPCMNTIETYSIASVPGATTYNWSVPAGAMILSGQTTPAISVQWSNTSGNVSVAASNNCGNGPQSQLPVTLSAAPGVPGPITGPSAACTGATVTFSVPSVTGESYTWSVPTDATILSGQGTASISVKWGMQAGFVNVFASIGSCSSLSNSVSVNTEYLPLPAQNLNGPDTVCLGLGGYQYSIDPISNASTYLWTLPAGAVITQGQGTSSVTLSFGNTATSGMIKASGSNLCGGGQEDSTFVVVTACTGIPVNHSMSGVTMWPNPASEVVNLTFENSGNDLQVQIIDAGGRVVIQRNFTGNDQKMTITLPLERLTGGLYLVRAFNDRGTYHGRLMIMKD